MKITKEYLKRVIKEELERALNEEMGNVSSIPNIKHVMSVNVDKLALMSLGKLNGFNYSDLPNRINYSVAKGNFSPNAVTISYSAGNDKSSVDSDIISIVKELGLQDAYKKAYSEAKQ